MHVDCRTKKSTFVTSVKVLLGVDAETMLALANLDGVLVPVDVVLLGPCEECVQGVVLHGDVI